MVKHQHGFNPIAAEFKMIAEPYGVVLDRHGPMLQELKLRCT
jgi:hypothetical protein